MADGVEYYVRAVLDTRRAAGANSKMAKFAKGMVSAGQSLEASGRRIMGNFGQMAAMAGRVAAPLAGALTAGGLLAGLAKGVQLNAEMESKTFSIASTLQLMGRNAGSFAANMEEGGYVMDQLFRRAATSPASFEQAQDLFTNMLPGAAQVTSDMERILDMSEAALSLGVQMGGDFRQAGADLRRIITGQAGADVRAWVEGLRTPIEEMAHEMGLTQKSGKDFVQAFNTMDPVKRFELVEKAIDRLGPATKTAGMLWAGLTSTIQSDFQLLMRSFGKATFDGLKRRMAQFIGPGGVLDPKGQTMSKLENFASFLGTQLAGFVDKAMGKIEQGLNYVANNWTTIVGKVQSAAHLILTAVKMFVAQRAVRGVVGGAMVGGGKAMQMGGNAIQGVQSFGGALAKVGMSAGMAAPILLPVALALGGLAVAFGGVAAYFVDNWQTIMDSVRNGAIQIQPLFHAIDSLWVQFVALGGAIMGTSDVAGIAQGIVNGLTNAVFFVAGAFSFMLRVFTYVQMGVQMVIMGVKGIAFAFSTAATALNNTIAWLLSAVATTLEKASGGQVGGSIRAASNWAYTQGKKSDADAKAIWSSMETTFDNFSGAWDKVDAFDNAVAKGGELTGGLQEAIDNWKKGKGPGEGNKGAGGVKPGRPTSTTNINKVIVNQDLRGDNPDRVIGAFNEALTRATRKRGQPTTALQNGV